MHTCEMYTRVKSENKGVNTLKKSVNTLNKKGEQKQKGDTNEYPKVNMHTCEIYTRVKSEIQGVNTLQT